jgi:hypothetical protein
LPFKSKKQRAFLYANKPEIAKKWSATYGSKVKKPTTRKKQREK